MKNFTSLLLIILTFKACKVSEKATDGSHLTIEGQRKYIPFQFSSKQKMCFTSDGGKTKCLKILYQDKIVEKINESLAYTAEEISIFLSDPEDLDIFFNITGSANYYNVDNRKSSFIGFYILNSDKCSWLASFQVTTKGKPIPDPFTVIEPTKTLNGKSFAQCITIRNLQCKDKYSELVVNSAVGVVAFRDKNNELFVFDRFE